MKEFLLVVLGATLSYLATIVVEKQRHRKNKIDEEKSYILRIKLGLQSFIAALEKLKDGYSYRNFFEFLRIDVLDGEVENLKFIKPNIDKLPQNKQEKILILLSDIELLAKGIRGMETFWASSRNDLGKPNSTFADSKEHENYFEKQRTQKLIELVEVKRRIEDLLRVI